VIEISLENNKIGTREVKEEIGSFRMEIPVSVTSTPERMLLIDPFAFFLVSLSKKWI
jgi:hypothetical protein